MDLTLKALLAEVYRKEISEKTLRAMQFKRQRGEKLGGDVPFGFAAVDGKLVADESEQAVVGAYKSIGNVVSRCGESRRNYKSVVRLRSAASLYGIQCRCREYWRELRPKRQNQRTECVKWYDQQKANKARR